MNAVSEALLFGDPGRKSSRTEAVLSRLLWLAVVLLALFLVGELLFHLWLAPRLVVRNISIQSDLPYTQAEVLAVAGIQGTPYYFSLQEQELRRRLAALPAVRQVQVRKSFPDTLRITLVGRRALSLLFYDAPGGGRDGSVPLAVDEQGVVFQLASSVADWDLPVISGVKFASAEMGMRLPESLRPFLQDLLALRTAEPELFRLISEIRLVPGSGSIREIVVYPVPYGVRLRFGPRLQGAGLRTAVVILDLLDKQGLSGRLQELDLRTGEVVYTLKED
jgi:cell division protein FtsQ